METTIYISLTMLIGGAIIFGLGLLILIFSFLSEDKQKVRSIALKMLLIGTVSDIVGFALCTSMLL